MPEVQDLLKNIYSYYFCLVYSIYTVFFLIVIISFLLEVIIASFLLLSPIKYIICTCKWSYIHNRNLLRLYIISYMYVLWSVYMELCNQLMCSSLGKTISLNLRILYLPFHRVEASWAFSHYFLRLGLHIYKVELNVSIA